MIGWVSGFARRRRAKKFGANDFAIKTFEYGKVSDIFEQGRFVVCFAFSFDIRRPLGGAITEC